MCVCCVLEMKGSRQIQREVTVRGASPRFACRWISFHSAKNSDHPGPRLACCTAYSGPCGEWCAGISMTARAFRIASERRLDLNSIFRALRASLISFLVCPSGGGAKPCSGYFKYSARARLYPGRGLCRFQSSGPYRPAKNRTALATVEDHAKPPRCSLFNVEINEGRMCFCVHEGGKNGTRRAQVE